VRLEYLGDLETVKYGSAVRASGVWRRLLGVERGRPVELDRDRLHELGLLGYRGRPDPGSLRRSGLHVVVTRARPVRAVGLGSAGESRFGEQTIMLR
jgi:hypothetical protein